MCQNAPLVNEQITFRDSWNSTDSYFSFPELFLSQARSRSRHQDKNIPTPGWDQVKNQHPLWRVIRQSESPSAKLRGPSSLFRTSEAPSVKWDRTFTLIKSDGQQCSFQEAWETICAAWKAFKDCCSLDKEQSNPKTYFALSVSPTRAVMTLVRMFSWTFLDP